MTVLVEEVYGSGMIRSNRAARKQIDSAARKAEGRVIGKSKEVLPNSRGSARFALALRMATRRHPIGSEE